MNLNQQQQQQGVIRHTPGFITHHSVIWMVLFSCFIVQQIIAKPQRVISLDTATDALVLQLADLDHIVAVRERSKKSDNSTQWKKASQLIGLKREMAEEVYRLQPDLVFFGQWSGRTTRELLTKLDIPIHRLTSPTSWEDVFSNILQMGKLLEEEHRAIAMVNDIKSRLCKVENALKHERPIRAIYYVGRGSTYGKDTKAHFVMRSAGISNIAAENEISGLGKMSVEEVILSQPDMIIFSSYHKHTPTLSRQILDHPAFRKFPKDVIQLDMPSRKINCTDASLVDCVEKLASIAHPNAF